MNRNKTLLAVVAALIIAAGIAWYFASPAYAMSQLKDAAIEGDAEELESRIDFPKVRESLKAQIRAMMAREIAKPEDKDNPFAKFGAVLAMGMVDSMVEGFVTPESMSAMIQEGKMQRADEQADASAEAEAVDWKIERDGLDRFTATPEASDGKPAPSLIFDRDGLGWKLSGMKLPPEGLKS